MIKMQSKLAVLLFVLLMVACKQNKSTTIPEQNNNIVSEQNNIVPEQNNSVTEQGIHLEKRNGYVYCYADSQRIEFHDEYLDEGAFAMLLYPKGKYAYIVGDIVPNSNGWIVRYHLYRVDTLTLGVKHLGDFAAIHFEDSGFKAATARLLNPDAECTADERYAIQDNFYNYDGVLIRKGKNEYGYDDMEREYGDTLVNACGFRYGD